MYQPRNGERVWIRPANTMEKVQRGYGLHHQFLSNEWQECLWDSFHNARLHDGSIFVRPFEGPTASFEQQPAPIEEKTAPLIHLRTSSLPLIPE